MRCYIGDKNDLMPVISNYAVNSDYIYLIEFTTDNRSAGHDAFKEFIRLVVVKKV
jgi:hypothetical protein